MPSDRLPKEVRHVELTPLPLMFVRKGLLWNFSLRDEAESALPVLTRTQTNEIERLLIRSLTSALLATRPGPEGGPSELDPSIALDLDQLSRSKARMPSKRSLD